MLKDLFIILILSLCINLSACGKKASQSARTDVYVAGYGLSTKYIAKIWKNGIEANLTNGQRDAQATGIYVSNGNVYVSGYEFNGSYNEAKYWKNGEAVNLTNVNHDSIATSVFINGQDVYLAGYESNGTQYEAKIWKNGVATIQSSNSKDAKANSVFVSGTDVYACGYTTDIGTNLTVATMWINGFETTLSNANNSAYATSITVINSDVYVLGYENNGSKFVTKLWKNGASLTDLSDGNSDTYSNGIFASGSDLYSLSNSSGNLSIWKNNTLQSTITGQVSQTLNDRSIAVSGNDVYVVGKKTSGIISTATLWKNGIASALGNGTYNTHATSIFVYNR
jgi:hypothetical protein